MGLPMPKHITCLNTEKKLPEEMRIQYITKHLIGNHHSFSYSYSITFTFFKSLL